MFSDYEYENNCEENTVFEENIDDCYECNIPMFSMENVELFLKKIRENMSKVENMDFNENDENKMTEEKENSEMEEKENQEENSETDGNDTQEGTEEETTWLSNLSFDSIIEIENIIYDLIDDYMENEIEKMSSPSFHSNMVKEIASILHLQIMETNLYDCHEENYDEVENMVYNVCDAFFENNTIPIPCRSYPNTFPSNHTEKEKEQIAMKIKKIKEQYQPKQRTTEWYEFRQKIITASNIWKVFGSESQQNSIIYEKCRPFVPPTTTTEGGGIMQVSVNSTLHHGIKYEPLSAMIYEHKYKTKLEDFGCIKHTKYPFIGASPDGIVVDSSSDRYGRMIEIKNIFNREINGIPKEEYWIQMQVQMETCDLDECDFVETRFKEFDNEENFYSSYDYEYKGIILYFIDKNTTTVSSPHYVYIPPFHETDVVEKEEIDEIINEKIEEMKEKYILYEKIYWYLDEFSCLLVKRNKEWFNHVLPKIKNIWEIIERERVEGFQHRAAISRTKKTSASSTVANTLNGNQHEIHIPVVKKVCLVKLEHPMEE